MACPHRHDNRCSRQSVPLMVRIMYGSRTEHTRIALEIRFGEW